MADASPLSGIKVVDMTEAFAGPYCAMLLGDLGADVIKVERPATAIRHAGGVRRFSRGKALTFYPSIATSAASSSTPRWPTTCRLADADRPSRRVSHEQSSSRVVATRSGFDPDDVACPASALVYGAISGYGHTGPKANRSGYDIIAQGEAGLMALTGPVDGGPSRFPTPMADISGGIYRLLGVLAALYARDRSGGRQRSRAIRRRRARRRADHLARQHRC